MKTDTKASLKLKGLTGIVFIELDGGAPGAKPLLAATPQGQVPEIASEKSALASVLDQLPKVAEQLPKVIAKFSGIESQTHQVLSDVGEVTAKVKENPSLLLRRPKKEDKPQPDKEGRP